MLGQVVQLPDNKKNLNGMIFGSDTIIYYFTDFDHPDISDIQVGSEVEFTEASDSSSSGKGFLKHFVKITSSCYPSPNCVCGHIYITTARNPDNVNVYEAIRNYEVCGESISREQALDEMIQVARSCGANAVLGTTLELMFNPVKKFLMYRYTGTLAQISAERIDTHNNDEDASNSPSNQSTTSSSESDHKDEKTASRPIQITKNIVRKNSPNQSMKFRLQLALLVFILFFLPLCGQLVLNYSHIIPRYASFFFGIVTCIMVFVIYINLNPHRNCGYVKKVATAHNQN